MKRCSSHSASSVSRILRAKLRSGVRNRFLASCWVIVLPPWTTWPAREIGDRGAHDADRIDAEMAVEAAVLGRDHRLRQIGRHLLQAQRLAEQVAEGRDQAAVGGEDRDARPPLGDGQLAGVGQGQREIAEHAAAEDRRPQRQQNRQPHARRQTASATERAAAGRWQALRRRSRAGARRSAGSARSRGSGIARPSRGKPSAGGRFDRAVSHWLPSSRGTAARCCLLLSPELWQGFGSGSPVGPKGNGGAQAVVC